jgi:hypothetical protein
MKRLSFTAVAFGALIVAPLSAHASVNPCSLVSQSQASAAMGAPALAPKHTAGRRGETCRWYSASHTMSVFVAIRGMQEFQAAKKFSKPLSGIGNDAIFFGGSIFFVKGSTVVQVNVYRTAADLRAPSPQTVSLSKAIAARI